MTSVQPDQVLQRCRVCGEVAAGFHFGAFTCEGCKSFFGRTYNNVSTLSECRNGGRCVVTRKTRTACKSCRLKRCLQAGMSRGGSRYGRRSNWFKMHYLQKETSSSTYTTQEENDRNFVNKTQTLSVLPSVKSEPDIRKIKDLECPQNYILTTEAPSGNNSRIGTNSSISTAHAHRKSGSDDPNLRDSNTSVSKEGTMVEYSSRSVSLDTASPDSSRLRGKSISKKSSRAQESNWNRYCRSCLKKNRTCKEVPPSVLVQQRFKEATQTNTTEMSIFPEQGTEAFTSQMPPICVPVLPQNWPSQSSILPCDWLSQSLLFYYNAFFCQTPEDNGLPTGLGVRFVTDMSVFEERSLNNVTLNDAPSMERRDFCASHDPDINSLICSTVAGRELTSPMNGRISEISSYSKTSPVVSPVSHPEDFVRKQATSAQHIQRSHFSQLPASHCSLGSAPENHTELPPRSGRVNNSPALSDIPIDLSMKKTGFLEPTERGDQTTTLTSNGAKQDRAEGKMDRGAEAFIPASPAEVVRPGPATL